MSLPLIKIFRYIAYSLFGIAIFIFFTYLNFPYYKLKDQFFLQVEKQSGVKIDSDEVKTLWTLGLQLNDIEISHPSWIISSLKLDKVTLSPSLFSLMMLQPKISFNIGLSEGEGEVEGFFQNRGKTVQRISLSTSGLPLKNKSWKELDISGLFTADLDISGNLQNFSGLYGPADIKIKNFILGKTTFLNMGISQLKISDIMFKGQFNNDKFTIEKIEMGKNGDDLEVHGNGDITINGQQPHNSKLNLKIKFKLSEKLKEEFSLFLPFIAAALKPDGFYALDIKGSVGAPLVEPKQL